MKCDEVQTLVGPYLDSELDARTTVEIQQHLKGCPECARLFAEEEKLEARLTAGLKGGQRTPALWAQIECAVREGLTQRRGETRRNAEQWNPLRLFAAHRVSALRPIWLSLRTGWQTSRWVWAGLATAWVVILVLNSAAREPVSPIVAGQDLPSASEMRLALKQKDLLLAELALTAEPAAKSKPAPPSPRSDRRKATLDT
jgi:anti-sigma factor RsiW